MDRLQVQLFIQQPGTMVVTLPVRTLIRTALYCTALHCPAFPTFVTLPTLHCTALHLHCTVLQLPSQHLSPFLHTRSALNPAFSCHMQGEKYHWTVSAGFSLADATNFYIQSREHWTLHKCVTSFLQEYQDIPTRIELAVAIRDNCQGGLTEGRSQPPSV